MSLLTMDIKKEFKAVEENDITANKAKFEAQKQDFKNLVLSTIHDLMDACNYGFELNENGNVIILSSKAGLLTIGINTDNVVIILESEAISLSKLYPITSVHIERAIGSFFTLLTVFRKLTKNTNQTN